MADELPNVEGDAGVREAIPVVAYDTLGNPVLPNGGSPVPSNSTFTPLAADATFTGDWSTDSNDQVGFSFEADQPGELFLDFSRDGGVTFSTIKKYQVFAGEIGRFDALVKGAGRSFRLRYVNGPTPQTSFQLLAFTGSSLFPYAKGDRDTPRFVAYSAAAIAADTYAIIVDLSDNLNFPHSDTGRVDLWSSFIFVDKPSNTVGALQVGVITRIDGTDADISYIQGVSFNAQSDRQIGRDRILNAPIQLGQTNGALNEVVTLFKATGVTAVNTAAPLPTPRGTTATPAVGDLIARFAFTSGGSWDGAFSAQYTTDVSTA